MLSHFTLVRIGKLIQATAEGEAQVEIVRQVLCERPAFETFTAFKRISKFHSKITSETLFAFLSENNSAITKDDAYYLIRLFDTDRDRRLSFSEFLEIVLPKTNPRLKERVQARKVYNSEEDEGLPYQIEHALVRIFEEELQCYRTCESIRQELAVSKDFSIMNAFAEIDTRNRGYFDTEDLLAFFDKISKELSEPQLKNFMYRIDKDRDGRVNFSDFLEIFYSKQLNLLKEKINNNKGSISNPADTTVSTAHFVASAVKSVSKGADSATFGEKSNFSDKYIDQLRDIYASPTRRNPSPNKKQQQFLGSGEAFFSPGSTNASSKSSKNNAGSDVETQSRHQTSQKVRFAESESSEFNRRSRSPMRVKDEVELVMAFEEMVKHMHTLEDVKNDMALRKDYNLYNAFAVFDVERRGSIDKKQLGRGLKRLGLDLTKGELYLIMKRFDTKNTGVIRFGDFSYVSMPKSKEYAKILESKLAYYAAHYGDPMKLFSKETLKTIRTFWAALAQGEVLSEALRQRLEENKTFKLQDAFKTLDVKDNGFVTAKQIGDFVEKYEVCFTKEELNGLVEKLTVSDAKRVSYEDFVNTMTPKSPEKYSR